MAENSEPHPAVACPVCGSGDIELIHRVEHLEAARAFVHPGRERARYERLSQHIRTLWGQDHCSHHRCTACAFGFSDPFVAGDDEFYRLAHDHKAGDYPSDKWEYRVARDLLKSWTGQHAATKLQVLEIGAGDGAFVKQIVPALIAASSVFCTEYDRYALEAIQQLGVRAALGDIRQLDMTREGPFDAIFMFQVLEHMDRLPDLFATLARVSSPDAHLVIAVPNAKRTLFNERHGGLLDMPPNHIGRWSEPAFQAVGQRSGWQVTRFLEEPTNPRESWQFFSYYRYARATQRNGSWSARLRGLRPTPLTRALEIAMVAGFAVWSLPLLPQLCAEGMGGSVLVHLRKQMLGAASAAAVATGVSVSARAPL